MVIDIFEELSFLFETFYYKLLLLEWMRSFIRHEGFFILVVVFLPYIVAEDLKHLAELFNAILLRSFFLLDLLNNIVSYLSINLHSIKLVFLN